jgi:hypothetical protein
MPKGRIKRDKPSEEVLSRLGFIKCGEKDDKGIPHSLDHFIASGKYSQYFHDVYGPNPNRIMIAFPSNDMEKVAEERYELRDHAGKLVAHGDGETFRVHNKETNEYDTVSGDVMFMGKLAAKFNTEKYTAKWDATLTLRFFVLGVKVYGLWWLSTKGDDSSIPAITSVLDKLMKFPGRIVGIPMNLTVEKVKSNKPGSKNSFPVINLVPDLTQGAMEKIHQLIQQGVQYEGMLLTDDRVNELTRQIGPPSEGPEGPPSSDPVSSCTPPVIDAEIVDDKPSAADQVKSKFGGPKEVTLEDALVEMESAATSAQNLNLVARDIAKKRAWTKAEQAELDKKYHELRGAL